MQGKGVFSVGTQHTSSDAYVSLNDLVGALPVTASCLKAWVSKGKFPKPIPALSARRSWWLKSDIQNWLATNGLPPLPDVQTGVAE